MAATVIDALMVTLGLDRSDFVKGQKQTENDLKKTRDAAAKTAKEMQQRGKEAAAFFSQIRNEALAMFAALAIGGGLESFISKTIDSAANLGFMADNLKMSTRDLQAWQRAAERAGGSAAGITAALRSSADEVARFKMGMTDESMSWFFRMGGNSDSLKDGNSYLLARAKIIQGIYKTDPTRAHLVATQMGITDDQFNFIKLGTAGILALVAAQEKNSVITRQDADQALRLRNMWLDLRDSLNATATTVLIQLMPSLKELGDWILNSALWIANHRKQIVDWVQSAVANIREFVTTVNDAAQAVGGWQNVLIALAALKVVNMASGLLTLAAALVSVGRGMAGVAAAGPGFRMALLGLGGGWLIGTEINKHLSTGTKNSIGEHIAELLASVGVHDAAEAVRRNSGSDKFLSGPNAEVVKMLMSRGWTRAQAAGLAANFARESGDNPFAVGDKGRAFGIGQWHGDRQAQFKKQFGHDIRQSTLEEQVAFADYELRHGNERAAGLRLMGAKNAADAGAIVSNYYERPADRAGEADRRSADAAMIYATTGSLNSLAVGKIAHGGASHSSRSSVTNTHIGAVNIHTAATDANGIARSIGPALKHHTLVAQANRGLN